jgi:hypothetical protein
MAGSVTGVTPEGVYETASACRRACSRSQTPTGTLLPAIRGRALDPSSCHRLGTGPGWRSAFALVAAAAPKG